MGVYVRKIFRGVSQVSQCLKNLRSVKGDRGVVSSIPGSVPSLGSGDPLEERMATPLQYLACRIHYDKGAQGIAVHGVTKNPDLTEVTEHSTQARYLELCHIVLKVILFSRRLR